MPTHSSVGSGRLAGCRAATADRRAAHEPSGFLRGPRPRGRGLRGARAPCGVPPGHGGSASRDDRPVHPGVGRPGRSHQAGRTATGVARPANTETKRGWMGREARLPAFAYSLTLTTMIESFLTRNALCQGDFRDDLPRFPAGSVDLVVTDPPYGIASDHALTRAGGRVMTTREAWGAWDQYSEAEYRRLLARLFAELVRILRPVEPGRAGAGLPRIRRSRPGLNRHVRSRGVRRRLPGHGSGEAVQARSRHDPTNSRAVRGLRSATRRAPAGGVRPPAAPAGRSSVRLTSRKTCCRPHPPPGAGTSSATSPMAPARTESTPCTTRRLDPSPSSGAGYATWTPTSPAIAPSRRCSSIPRSIRPPRVTGRS